MGEETMNKQRHLGKKVLITGAAGGMGHAVAKRYAQEGATVALVDRDEEGLEKLAHDISSMGGTAVWGRADVADFDSCEQCHGQLVDQIGDMDILINNAGVTGRENGKTVRIWEMSPDNWQSVIDVNLTGVFNFTRLLSPAMMEKKYGRIVSLSSVAGKAFFGVAGTHYCTTKSALIGFTRHVAGELGPYNITVNAVAPGRINTPMIAQAGGDANDEIINHTPMGRLGEPSEVAGVICTLTSPDSDFVTGQVLDVAGGWLMT